MAKTILIVEDEKDLREIISFALEKAGYRVVQAKDGVSATMMIPADKPHLILLDLMLPRISGIEVLEQLQSVSTGEIPVVVVTAVSGREDYMAKVRAFPNVKEILSKPITARKVIEAVERALKPSESVEPER